MGFLSQAVVPLACFFSLFLVGKWMNSGLGRQEGGKTNNKHKLRISFFFTWKTVSLCFWISVQNREKGINLASKDPFQQNYRLSSKHDNCVMSRQPAQLHFFLRHKNARSACVCQQLHADGDALNLSTTVETVNHTLNPF